MTTKGAGIGSSIAATWRPARKFPETYPGSCPEHHYLLHNDAVLPVAEVGTARFTVPAAAGESVDEFLGRHGCPPLARRYPALAYGANRNPATLVEKLRNYGYVSPTGQTCLPVLRASLSDADVAACGLHGQGYLYGELLLDSPFCQGVKLDVRVAFLDAAQLRVMNDSEGLRGGLYAAARIPGVRVAGLPGLLAPLGYVANAHVWRSPLAGSPLAFGVLPARDRRLPGLTSAEMMEHALDGLGLRSAVSAVTGLTDDASLAGELTKYLNGQWWYQFNTGDTPIAGYSGVLELFRAAMADSRLPSRTRDHLADRGLLLDTDRVYDAPVDLTLGAMLR